MVLILRTCLLIVLSTYNCCQGEDVRAGVRAPSKLTDLQHQHLTLFDELEQVAAVLEQNYTDMQVYLCLITRFYCLEGKISGICDCY